jgi:hypothetical protein
VSGYRVMEQDGRLLIVQGWTIVAEMNEDRDGYVDPALGSVKWAQAKAKAEAMAMALNNALNAAEASAAQRLHDAADAAEEALDALLAARVSPIKREVDLALASLENAAQAARQALEALTDFQHEEN